MICQGCGVEAPTKHVTFYRNIGALVMRFSNSIDGKLCKSCIHRYFWKFTPVTILVGWLGVISLIVAPFMVLNNIGRYMSCLFMRSVPRGAEPPRLTDDVVERLGPHTESLVAALRNGENIEKVASELARRASVTPGQVVLYIRALIAAAEQHS